jgi:hypothetical protein
MSRRFQPFRHCQLRRRQLSLLLHYYALSPLYLASTLAAMLFAISAIDFFSYVDISLFPAFD